jgi:hypothetical protein
MSEEVKLYPYEVIGKNARIAQNGKDFQEGEKIELSRQQALSLRAQIKALTPEGEFEALDQPDVIRNTAGWRDHEKEQILKDRKAVLETELDKIDAELERIEKGRKAAEKPAAGKEAAKAKG